MTKRGRRACWSQPEKSDYQEKGKRGCVVAPKWIFMRLRTDFYLAQMHVYLAWTSKEMHMDPDVLVCPIPSTYVGMQWWCGDDVVGLPPHIPMRIWFNTSDLTQWSGFVTRIASDLGWARQKYCWETESACPSPLVPVKSNLSVVPTSLLECFLADLEVSSCSKIRFLLYL
jgi:hypothetical protein